MEAEILLAALPSAQLGRMMCVTALERLELKFNLNVFKGLFDGEVDIVVWGWEQEDLSSQYCYQCPE